MVHHGEAVLRQRVCSREECRSVFWICEHCDRGQRDRTTLTQVVVGRKIGLRAAYRLRRGDMACRQDNEINVIGDQAIRPKSPDASYGNFP